jgi:hypothetical protein
MDRSKYPADWRAISKRIRAREGQRCKWCAAPNGELISRNRRCPLIFLAPGLGVEADELHVWIGGLPSGAVHLDCGEKTDVWCDAIRCVLTVAHLDHDTRNNGDDNLAALCQRCHLNHDRAQHVATRREAARGRLAVRELFEDPS